VRIDRGLAEEQERRLDRHDRDDLLDRDELGGLRQGQAANLALDEGLHVAHGAQVAQLLVVNGHLQHILHEDDDFHHGQGIDAKILDNPQIIIRILQFSAQIRLHIALDDTQHDGGQMLGIAGFAKLRSRFISRCRAALNCLAKVRIVFGRKRFEWDARRIGCCLCHWEIR